MPPPSKRFTAKRGSVRFALVSTRRLAPGGSGGGGFDVGAESL